MDEPRRIPGYYPETPAAQVVPTSRYTPINGHTNNSPNANSHLGSIGRAGGPIRRTNTTAISRARAHSTPYARPPTQNTPGSGNRSSRRDEDEDEVCVLLDITNCRCG